ncbi:MAG: NosD domain-containing protein, partial [Candidatus ainarchaeum sp.]|nr:NosD domain-containing protein [Candidatus ainarchaeum sp.]
MNVSKNIFLFFILILSVFWATSDLSCNLFSCYFTDDFSDNLLNSTYWEVHASGEDTIMDYYFSNGQLVVNGTALENSDADTNIYFSNNLSLNSSRGINTSVWINVTNKSAFLFGDNFTMSGLVISDYGNIDGISFKCALLQVGSDNSLEEMMGIYNGKFYIILNPPEGEPTVLEVSEGVGTLNLSYNPKTENVSCSFYSESGYYEISTSNSWNFSEDIQISLFNQYLIPNSGEVTPPLSGELTSYFDNFYLYFNYTIPNILVVNSSSACIDGDYYFDNITDAVNAASHGDTIYVCPANYDENIVINKSINIHGYMGKANVTALNPDNAVFTLSSNYINMSNFTVNGSLNAAGIQFTFLSNYSIIWNINSYNNQHGFKLLESSNNTLIDNIAFNNNETGFLLEYSSNNTLIDNIAFNNTYGGFMLLLYSLDNTFIRNNASENPGGFILYLGSSNNILIDNWAYDNSLVGFYLYNSNYNNLSNNTIYHNPIGFELNKNSSFNYLIQNNITAVYWINNSNETNLFNFSGIGNIYYLSDGTPSWEVYDIQDDDEDGWADSGSDRPFNSSLDQWIGFGEDWYPWAGIMTSPTPKTPSSDSPSTKTPTLEKYSFNCLTGEIQIKASYLENPIYDLGITLSDTKKYTDNNGIVSFNITSDGHYTFKSETTGTYNSRTLILYNLILCPEQTEEPEVLPEPEEPEVVEEPEEEPEPEEGVTKAQAEQAIKAAEDAINKAMNEGKDVSQAQIKLYQAKDAYELADYELAKSLAD